MTNETHVEVRVPLVGGQTATLILEPGTIAFFVGPNGSGKSALFSFIAKCVPGPHRMRISALRQNWMNSEFLQFSPEQVFSSTARRSIVFALDAAPMAKNTVAGVVAATNRAQHDGHAIAGLDLAVIDDVASARRCMRVEGSGRLTGPHTGCPGCLFYRSRLVDLSRTRIRAIPAACSK